MMSTPTMILTARRTIAACLLLQFFLSLDLWIAANRAFPFVPVFSFWPSDDLGLLALPAFICACIGLLFVLLMPDRRLGLWCFLLPLLFLILQDITRLQVWLYHLTGLLLLLFIKKDQRYFWPRWGIMALYFWSGLHKLNVYFVDDTFPWFMEQAGPLSFLGDYSGLAIFVAVFELSIGLGLFWKRSRRWAAMMGMVFHLTILYLLGPFGHAWNEVVWPWNLVMMLLLYLLFFRHKEGGVLNPIPELKANDYSLILFVLLLLPGLNAFRLWDEQLSFKMYAGTNPEGVFYFDERDRSCFGNAPIIHRSSSLTGTATLRFIFDDFAFQELKVPPYASERSLQQIGRHFCNCVQYPQNAGLEILWVDPWDKNKEELKEHPCSELLGANKNGTPMLKH